MIFTALLDKTHKTCSINTHPTKLIFAASDRHLVDEFYRAALLAGGSAQVQPTEGADESSYYKAVVVDFDGNHIGAMYRPHTFSRLGTSARSSDDKRIAEWQSDVASKSEHNAKYQSSSGSPKIIVNNIAPPVEVHRIKQDNKEDGEISTRESSLF